MQSYTVPYSCNIALEVYGPLL